jgi:glycosyltransferase involved in cell wall biosynthesis
MPTSWHEPFGLVAIEAMATGTPVISLNNGSLKEIILDKKTGFLVENFKGIIDAVSLIPSLNRADCRTIVEEKFNLKIVAQNYLDIYNQIIKN